MKPDQENLLLPELHRRIARHLLKNPTEENGRIATALGVHINTVQPVVRELKSRVLSDSFQVLDWDAIGLGLRYRIDIQINQRQLHRGGGPEDLNSFLEKRPPKDFQVFARNIRTQERLALFIWHHLVSYVAWKIEEGVSNGDEKLTDAIANYADRVHIEDIVVLLGGQADLSIAVRVHNSAIIRKFVTHGLRMMSGINNTTTSQEVWSCVEPL